MKTKKHLWGIPLNSISLLIGCFLIFLLMGIITYRKVSAIMIEQSKQNGMALARELSKELDGDELAAISSEDDPAYAKVMDILLQQGFYTYVKYIYTMKLDDEGTLRYIVDADPEDPDDPEEFGKEYPWIESMAPAFEGQVCCDEEVTSDEWGSYYSAYAPVFDKNGDVAAIVGVDIGTDFINAYLNRLMRNLAIILSSFALCSVAIYSVFARRVTGMDDLTGVSNYEYLVKTGNRLKKKGDLKNYTAVLVNIKGFKYINRQFGYDFGNTLLKNMAEYLKKGLSRGEVIARTGNDNFCVLIYNDHAPGYVVERLQATNPVSLEAAVVGGVPAPIRCGIYRIQQDDTMEQVMGICTVVMNVARTEKKDDIVFYNKKMYENIFEEGDLLTSYKKAIRDGEFKVFYQPKVDINTNTLCGAEALVRWLRDGRYISPGQFIPLLENEGLITELDFYVFETVCNDIRLWIQQGLKPVPVSSNFSKLHLSDPGFAERVIETVDKWQTDHSLISVEMTESSGYSGMEALTSFVEKMSKAGIRVDMDDFGTGYSSLSLLGDVNMDTIKIDKSFVDRIFGEKKTGAKLVENVIRMISDLGRDVICEGVETSEQVEFIKNTECSQVQGFYFDKPLEQSEFTSRLAQPAYGK